MTNFVSIQFLSIYMLLNRNYYFFKKGLIDNLNGGRVQKVSTILNIPRFMMVRFNQIFLGLDVAILQ
jgi:hypothetical protein